MVLSVSLPLPYYYSQHFTGLVSEVLDGGSYMGCNEEIYGMNRLYAL